MPYSADMIRTIIGERERQTLITMGASELSKMARPDKC